LRTVKIAIIDPAGAIDTNTIVSCSTRVFFGTIRILSYVKHGYAHANEYGHPKIEKCVAAAMYSKSGLHKLATI
jgi:hypothetical protein